MANIKHLVKTYSDEEKTYILSFRCNGGAKVSSYTINTRLSNIKWEKIPNLTRIYRKVIRDEDFGDELQSLQEVLDGFRLKDDPNAESTIDYTLNIAIDYNEIDDPVEGVRYMFRPR